MMDVVINFFRPGKGITRYVEELVDDNPVRIKTFNSVPLEFSQKWCEETWWQNRCIPRGILIASVTKYLFYKEWFSVMQLIASGGDSLGYYVDIDTPLQKLHGEYYLTDLFLDLWIYPDGKYIELDRDEFEEGIRLGLLNRYQSKKANQVIGDLKMSITNGEFYRMIS
jgi:hypothetical protein